MASSTDEATASASPAQGYAVGLDVGGTKILGVLVGPDGSVEGTLRLPTRWGPEGVVSSAAEAVTGLLDAAGVPVERLTSVGVGVPGLVDPASGGVQHAVNLGIDAETFLLASLLSEHLGGVPVSVDNDLNVAALGAASVTGGDVDLAFLALGTGLAAGIVLGGELRRGVSGAAGEIGHIPVDPRGPLCACGQRGCLETYASGTALGARWPSQHGRPAPAELFEAAAGGDERAVLVKNEFVTAVAAAIRLLVLSYDVEHVVLGGGVSILGAPLLDAVAVALEEQASSSPFLASLEIADRVRLCPTDVPVAAVGAALAGRRKVSKWKL
ncbi:Sugar kinase of the NBD/HSP70 family, may contain an N-terminal HTH domain [Paraoerskovia marina]|uniref:Sugar kinase of the NBD/HSP70 family, may contain an N-terminal HTH domain n=1 Tax=Paraoerskovia marina TaxID=545619 RepID=A0A1H1UES0_9CELL|nr:ROK family protein [Paraoerskovia marina]SDS70953.1 Sugar kinase of the NBD/HSP70 family, may contain an N-terminal HTH domain [Paraoerskovia marina]